MVGLLARRPFDFGFANYPTIDELIDSFFYNIPKTSKPPRSITVKEENEKVVIQYALAGFKEDDISVSVTNNKLIVQASNEGNREVDRKFACSFKEEFVIAKHIDLQQGKVDFTNGLLTIEFPLKREKMAEEKQLFGIGFKKGLDSGE